MRIQLTRVSSSQLKATKSDPSQRGIYKLVVSFQALELIVTIQNLVSFVLIQIKSSKRSKSFDHQALDILFLSLLLFLYSGGENFIVKDITVKGQPCDSL